MTSRLDVPAIVWLRQDLRLADNPALQAAAQTGQPLLFVYVLDDATPGRWKLGGASRWWLDRSLRALGAALAKKGARLILRRGAAEAVLPTILAETGASAVFWNRLYEPYAIARDTRMKATLQKSGVAVETFNGALLHEPWSIRTRQDQPFKVFTPFWRAASAIAPRAPLPPPHSIQSFKGDIASDELDAWRLTPRRPDWATGFDPVWSPGEKGAAAALDAFLDAKLAAYPDARNRPDHNGTSRLSPHLHFGEISPVQIWRAAQARAGDAGRPLEKFLAEIGWREFSHHLLFHWPTLPEANWRSSFDAIPWRDDDASFRAWTRGQTGFPIVDAGMRELWATGYMHNRVRMIAASFLIKDLLIDWRRGADWFWDTLLDADLANNSASWQWVAGSGADATPYFRIFNPVTQGKTYDPNGAYVRRWAPELANLPDELIHAPWLAAPNVLRDARVELGRTYPQRIVDHATARKRALDVFSSLKSAA